jgi:hypothetical protein
LYVKKGPDTGAQVSLIRKPVADECGLKGKSITIARVGGKEEELVTKVYEIPIPSFEDKATYVIIVEERRSC